MLIVLLIFLVIMTRKNMPKVRHILVVLKKMSNKLFENCYPQIYKTYSFMVGILVIRVEKTLKKKILGSRV